MKRLDPTVRDVLVGALLYGILVEIIGVIVVENRLSYSLGLVYGYGCIIFMICHMYLTLEKALDMEPKDASKYGIRNNILRYVIVFLLLVIAAMIPQISVVAVIIMIFGMKISAALQPKVNKYITSRIFDGRR